MTPLKNPKLGLGTAEEIASIFCNIEELLEVSKSLYNSLDPVLQTWTDESMIGELFSQLVSFFGKVS